MSLGVPVVPPESNNNAVAETSGCVSCLSLTVKGEERRKIVAHGLSSDQNMTQAGVFVRHLSGQLCVVFP